MSYLEMEKKFLHVWKHMNSTYQFLNMYKKMAQGMSQELQRSTFYYQNEIQWHQKKRTQDAWMTAEVTERKFQDLRREYYHNR